MTISKELKNLKFMIDSGISEILQNTPNIRYKIINKKENSNKIKLENSIDKINNLSELKEAIENSNICKLKEKSINTVFADGNPDSKIMLIGEAPGADEDKLGKPFVGKAGQYLDKMLKAINLNRKLVYITNVIPWRPPNNREPTNDEILQCLPFVQRHIELIEPNLLVLVGGTAAKSILSTNIGITKLRGIWHSYNSLNLKKTIPTRAIFHPSFLLRKPIYKKEAWEDLQEIEKKVIL